MMSLLLCTVVIYDTERSLNHYCLCPVCSRDLKFFFITSCLDVDVSDGTAYASGRAESKYSEHLFHHAWKTCANLFPSYANLRSANANLFHIYANLFPTCANLCPVYATVTCATLMLIHFLHLLIFGLPVLTWATLMLVCSLQLLICALPMLTCVTFMLIYAYANLCPA